MTIKIRIIYAMAKNVFKASLQNKVMYGLLGIALLFTSMAYLPFVMKELQNFTGAAPFAMAVQIGFFYTNVFMILIVFFVSFGMLQNQLESEKVILILAKPVKKWEMLLGITLGLIWVLFLNWLVITGGVWLITFLQTKQLNLNIFSGMSVVFLIAVLFLSLVIALYTFIPSSLSGILAFLLLLSSFGTLDSAQLIQWLGFPFLIKAIEITVACLPKMIPLWTVSMNILGLVSVKINNFGYIIHTLILIVVLNVIGLIKFNRAK